MKHYTTPELSLICCLSEDVLTMSLSADGMVNDNYLFDDVMNQDN